jgi:DedD protein
MAEAQDVDTLRRRGRRRLVGAVALVLAAVIVLPMVFDPEPPKSTPVSVKIPGEEEGKFAPKRVVKAPEPQAAEPKKVEQATPPAEKKIQEARKEEAKPAPAPSGEAERKRAEAALANTEFVIAVGAFAEPQPVIDRLSGAKLPYFTEPVATKGGTITRVRAGPFPSREAADQALEKLKQLGFKPGNVAARS